MNGDPFKTPLNRARPDAQSIRPTTAAKRDSLAAELERGIKIFTKTKKKKKNSHR